MRRADVSIGLAFRADVIAGVMQCQINNGQVVEAVADADWMSSGSFEGSAKPPSWRVDSTNYAVVYVVSDFPRNSRLIVVWATCQYDWVGLVQINVYYTSVCNSISYRVQYVKLDNFVSLWCLWTTLRSARGEICSIALVLGSTSNHQLNMVCWTLYVQTNHVWAPGGILQKIPDRIIYHQPSSPPFHVPSLPKTNSLTPTFTPEPHPSLLPVLYPHLSSHFEAWGLGIIPGNLESTLLHVNFREFPLIWSFRYSAKWGEFVKNLPDWWHVYSYLLGMDYDRNRLTQFLIIYFIQISSVIKNDESSRVSALEHTLW